MVFYCIQNVYWIDLFIVLHYCNNYIVESKSEIFCLFFRWGKCGKNITDEWERFSLVSFTSPVQGAFICITNWDCHVALQLKSIAQLTRRYMDTISPEVTHVEAKTCYFQLKIFQLLFCSSWTWTKMWKGQQTWGEIIKTSFYSAKDVQQHDLPTTPANNK